jgi:hypothetical protein
MKSQRCCSLFFPLVAILLFSGCRLAKVPEFQPLESRPPDKAVIYIYRPLISRFRASDYHLPYLFVDNKKIVPMKVGRYTWLYAEPGTHVFEIKATTFFRHTAMKTLEHLSLAVEAGKEYYLGFEQNLESLSPVLTPWLSLITVTDNPDNGDPLPTYRVFWSVPKEIAVRQLRKTVYLGLDPD